MTTKKIVFGLLGVVVVAVAVGIGLVVTQIDRMVADAVESYGRAATGTDVSVGGVDIAVTSGRGELDRLTVENPDGFSTDYALRLEDIRVALALGSLTGEVPVVEEVVVDDAHLNVEQRGDTLNLAEIQRNMSRADESAAADAEDEARIIIDRFRLTNGRVTLTSDALSEPETLELDDVVVSGVGRASGGATYGEATEAVLQPIMSAARSAAEQRLRESASDAVRREVEEEAGERLRELLEREEE